MGYKCHCLYFFISSMFLVCAQHPKIYQPKFCFSQKYKGSRLNTSIFNTTHVSQELDCLIVCDKEPCCRSINFKKTWSSDDDQNCEMLHNVVYNTSEKLIQANASFNHLYFLDSEKEYNESCLKIKDGLYRSEILKQNQTTISLLEQWLGGVKPWKLCYRATDNGWAASTFHSLCDYKKPIIIIIRSRSYVFGAYSDVAFEGNAGYRNSSNSFIFSLVNKDNLSPFKSPIKSNHANTALQTSAGHGPIFGGGNDIYIASNANANNNSFTNFGHSYQTPDGYSFHSTKTRNLLAGSYNFTPNEIEIFYFN